MAEDKVTIVGIGRLGLCTALCIERAGYDVLGVDVFPGYVEAINNKTFTSSEPRVNEFLASSTRFRATIDLREGVNFANVILILVDTPSTGGERHYDTSKVARILSFINDMKVSRKHVVIGCTVLPGYIRNIARSLISECASCSLSYNPEFIQQGDIIRGFLNPDMVLIGEGCTAIGDFLEKMYTRVCENKPHIARMSAESAEITKIAVNCFITTKISYANMVGDIADRTPGADKHVILKAIGSDSRIGGKCLLPGYGFGGPCFPRDNRALGGYAKSIGVEPVIPEGTDRYNVLHSEYQAAAMAATGTESFVFDDVAYKPKCPVPIIEESQKLIVAARLARMGKQVTIRDRKDIIDSVRSEYGLLFKYQIA